MGLGRKEGCRCWHLHNRTSKRAVNVVEYSKLHYRGGTLPHRLSSQQKYWGCAVLSQERIKELFEYNTDTGDLIWKVSRGTRKKGSIAGSINSEGYLCIGVDGEVYHAHRIIWIYVYGEPPEKPNIDHINREKTDNRISNLRAATCYENVVNRGLQKNNKSGCSGVRWIEKDKRWRVTIRGKAYGQFKTFEEAREVRKNTAENILGEFFVHC